MRAAHLLGDAAVDEARQRAVTVRRHGDQVDVELGRLAEDHVDRLARPTTGAPVPPLLRRCRRVRPERTPAVSTSWAMRVARVEVRDAQEHHLGVAEPRELDDVVEDGMVDRRRRRAGRGCAGESDMNRLGEILRQKNASSPMTRAVTIVPRTMTPVPMCMSPITDAAPQSTRSGTMVSGKLHAEHDLADDQRPEGIETDIDERDRQKGHREETEAIRPAVEVGGLPR